MKRLLHYSIFFLCLSCGTSYRLPDTYQKEKIGEYIANPYFGIGEYQLRATIEAYGHSFNGVLAIKTATYFHIVALTTDFGNTLLKFYYKRGEGWRVDYIAEALDRKPLIKLLQRDFQDLLEADRYGDKYIHNQEVAYVVTEGKRKVYLFENQNKKIYQQLNTKKSKPYTTFTAHYRQTGELSQIVIEHHTLPMKMTLDVLP